VVARVRPEFTDDVVELERALEQNRAQLDPATVEVIERSLESIDRAIEDARAALAAIPAIRTCTGSWTTRCARRSTFSAAPRA
jgi:hypothetical protein